MPGKNITGNDANRLLVETGETIIINKPETLAAAGQMGMYYR